MASDAAFWISGEAELLRDEDGQRVRLDEARKQRLSTMRCAVVSLQKARKAFREDGVHLQYRNPVTWEQMTYHGFSGGRSE